MATDVMNPDARLKQVKSEIVQWENRIEHAKSEYNGLKKQSETIQQTIDAKTADYQAYVGGREKALRDGQTQLTADQQTLEKQREELKGLLNALQGDRNALAAERHAFENEKSKFQGKQTCVNDFIQAVRRAYNVLPE